MTSVDHWLWGSERRTVSRLDDTMSGLPITAVGSPGLHAKCTLHDGVALSSLVFAEANGITLLWQVFGARTLHQALCVSLTRSAPRYGMGMWITLVDNTNCIACDGFICVSAPY